MKIKWEWEELDPWNFRAQVIGGWLVKTLEESWPAPDQFGNSNHVSRVTMCFVPDPNHEWTIDKLWNE